MNETNKFDGPFPIVGIGASAGGLEALRDFVQAVSPGSGMCYVVVQHLAPDHPSIMDQLLASHSKIPVVKIENGLPLEPDKVFVIPAGPELTISNGSFRLHEKPAERGLRTPIDRFFHSIAEQAGRRAYCVVLSGTGSDGTAGLRAVKAAGGVAIAQEARSAKFSGMPENAAATGLVDFVLKPNQIPIRLQEIEAHRSLVEKGDDARSIQDEIGEKLGQIISLIDQEEGHDFSSYKTGTLIRRVERRMTILRQSTVDGLINMLKSQPEERNRLLQDFLIGVTQFFRDSEAFNVLRDKVLRPLVNSEPARIRVWVPGASTGEEAYSIAMLLAEAIDKLHKHIPVQVFGTDIDLSALARARTGSFSASALDPLTPSQREQFFIRDGERVLAAPRLREMCVFAPHNLIQDPPFSRLDLISCRNVLIYLNSDIQQKIIPRFHYALNSSGVLFLGPSESLGSGDRLFRPIEKEFRIFRRNDDQHAGYSSLSDWRERNPASRSVNVPRDNGLPALPNGVRLEQSFEQSVEQHVLRYHAPPHAVINQRNEVVYVSENIAPFVGPSRGAPSSALDMLLVRELRLPVRTAVEKVRETGNEFVEENVIVPIGDQKHVVDIVASAAPQGDEAVLVVLRPIRVQGAEELAATTDARIDHDRDLLDRELTLTRRQLAAAQSEHETVDQELRSSNEELLSMNEELQSANEELETSREELQSINEELETINAELTENNVQLTRANSDLKNLFESTEISTLFLDGNLCVRRFTPETARLFGVKERDLGRPLEDLSSKIPYETVKADALVAIEDLRPASREITIGEDAETYLMRTRPYRTVDDRLDGCVVSFIDITERKKSEQQLVKSEQRYRSVIEAHSELLCRFLADGRLTLVNNAYAATFGKEPQELIGESFYELILDEEHRKLVRETVESLSPASPSATIEYTILTASGDERWTEWTHRLVETGNGSVEYQAIGRDVTDRRIAQLAVVEREQMLNFALDVAALGAWELDVQTGEAERSLRHDQIFGYKDFVEEWNLETFLAHVVPEHREEVRARYELAISKCKNWAFECCIDRADGQRRWISAKGRPILNEKGNVHVLLGTVQDITETKTAELEIRASEARKTVLMQELQHRVKNTLATVLAIIRFSARRTDSVSDLVEGLQSRLGAISKTHDLLTQQDWRGSRLSDLIYSELTPFEIEGAQRFELQGCDPYLNARQALSLCLALHELVTNAAKYGSLSDPNGRITISCEENGEKLKIVWKETDGPKVKVSEDQQKGFGSFLITTALAQQISGTSELHLEPDGVRCVIELPIES